MHFNDVFSVSFWEAGGKLVHAFCFLSSSVLRHSADRQQIVPNCNTQAIFPITIFVYFMIFKRLFLHISIVGHVHLHTPGSLSFYTAPLLVICILQLICPSSTCPSVWVSKYLLYFCQISPRICQWSQQDRKMTPEFMHTDIAEWMGSKKSFWEAELCVVTMQRCMDVR